jgi:hypothetical protein
MFSGVSSVSTWNADDQETVSWGVFLVDAVGDNRSGDNTTVVVGTLLWKILDLGIFYTTAGVSEFLEYQFLDSWNSTVHINVYMERAL